MSRTQVKGRQVQDGDITRDDLCTTIPDKAVITKLSVTGNAIVTHTGVDPGTGDVELHINELSSYTAELDFGDIDEADAMNTEVFVTVPDIKETSKVICTLGGATADHDNEDYLLEEIRITYSRPQPGIGFTIFGIAQNGTFGKYLVNILIEI